MWQPKPIGVGRFEEPNARERKALKDSAAQARRHDRPMRGQRVSRPIAGSPTCELGAEAVHNLLHHVGPQVLGCRGGSAGSWALASVPPRPAAPHSLLLRQRRGPQPLLSQPNASRSPPAHRHNLRGERRAQALHSVRGHARPHVGDLGGGVASGEVVGCMQKGGSDRAASSRPWRRSGDRTSSAVESPPSSPASLAVFSGDRLWWRQAGGKGGLRHVTPGCARSCRPPAGPAWQRPAPTSTRGRVRSGPSSAAVSAVVSRPAAVEWSNSRREGGLGRLWCTRRRALQFGFKLSSPSSLQCNAAGLASLRMRTERLDDAAGQLGAQR
jgi:hypothetical protein